MDCHIIELTGFPEPFFMDFWKMASCFPIQNSTTGDTGRANTLPAPWPWWMLPPWTYHPSSHSDMSVPMFWNPMLSQSFLPTLLANDLQLAFPQIMLNYNTYPIHQQLQSELHFSPPINVYHHLMEDRQLGTDIFKYAWGSLSAHITGMDETVLHQRLHSGSGKHCICAGRQIIAQLTIAPYA